MTISEEVGSFTQFLVPSGVANNCFVLSDKKFGSMTKLKWYFTKSQSFLIESFCRISQNSRYAMTCSCDEYEQKTGDMSASSRPSALKSYCLNSEAAVF